MNDPQRLLGEYARTGSEPAFTELVRTHINFVYSTALRLMNGDAHSAEDVTQMVFADLARSARTLSRNVMPGGWLHRHTCFVASRKMRSERRRRTREQQAAEMSAEADQPATGLDDIAHELDEAINRLDDPDRSAILLRFYEQRDFADVGRGLGVSVEAARKRVTRAMEKLQASLASRGFTRSAGLLAAGLGTGLVVIAPAELSAEMAASALTAAAATRAAMGIKILAAGKLKLAALIAALAAAAGTPVYIAHQSLLAARAERTALQAHIKQLTALQASNAAAASQNSGAAPQIRRNPTATPLTQDQFHELMRLRGEVGMLRDQLAKAQAPIPSGTATSEKDADPANIEFSFTSIPMMQLLDMYQTWSGKHVDIAANAPVNKSIWLKTVKGQPLTKAQAAAWAEEALRDQGHVSIVTNNDGSLSAVPATASP